MEEILAGPIALLTLALLVLDLKDRLRRAEPSNVKAVAASREHGSADKDS